MDRVTPLPFAIVSLDPVEHDLIEIEAAIAMVAGGFATRVHLVGLLRPESAAPIGLAHAQVAGVDFSVDRGLAGAVAITIGPSN